MMKLSDFIWSFICKLVKHVTYVQIGKRRQTATLQSYGCQIAAAAAVCLSACLSKTTNKSI